MSTYKTTIGKLARVNRLPNTKNGGPMYEGDIVTLSGQLVHFRTKPDSSFSYQWTLTNFAGAFGQFLLMDWRGKTRIVGVEFKAPPDKVIFSYIGG